eukprot:scaffold26077_cov19-Tisochrysis_lutea.AAC.1
MEVYTLEDPCDPCYNNPYVKGDMTEKQKGVRAAKPLAKGDVAGIYQGRLITRPLAQGDVVGMYQGQLVIQAQFFLRVCAVNVGAGGRGRTRRQVHFLFCSKVWLCSRGRPPGFFLSFPVTLLAGLTGLNSMPDVLTHEIQHTHSTPHKLACLLTGRPQPIHAA